MCVCVCVYNDENDAEYITVPGWREGTFDDDECQVPRVLGDEAFSPVPPLTWTLNLRTSLLICTRSSSSDEDELLALED